MTGSTAGSRLETSHANSKSCRPYASSTAACKVTLVLADYWQHGTIMACLGGEAGGSGGVGEQSLLRVVSGHVPGWTGCGIKVIMPMLVKCIIGVGYGVDQTIVQHLGGTCRACQGVSTSSTC